MSIFLKSHGKCQSPAPKSFLSGIPAQAQASVPGRPGYHGQPVARVSGAESGGVGTGSEHQWAGLLLRVMKMFWDLTVVMVAQPHGHKRTTKLYT